MFYIFYIYNTMKYLKTYEDAYNELGVNNFKEGDYVRLKKESHNTKCNYWEIGDILKIINVDIFDHRLPYEIEGENDINGYPGVWVSYEQIEPLTEQEIEEMKYNL